MWLYILFYTTVPSIGGEASPPPPPLWMKACNNMIVYMHPTCAYSILHHVWRVSVESVDLCLGKAPSKKGTDSAQVHQRLFTILKTMRDFYHCGGNGLDDKDLDSKEFMVPGISCNACINTCCSYATFRLSMPSWTSFVCRRRS